jgi:peptidyl-prolyl cis-trans isomerase B (cyclophilin B)
MLEHKKVSPQNFLLVILLAVSAIFSILLNLSSAQVARAKDHTLLAAKSDKDPIVDMETNKGMIKVRIYQSEAPITSANFLDLVSKGFYNGLTFHRHEPGFCIQGGDPKGDGTGGYIDPKTHRERTIKLEINPSNPHLQHDAAGVLAMARSGDPNSASSQFYFTLGPAMFLNESGGGYAVFGRVTSGLDVVKALTKGDKMTKVTIEGAK